jgi:hypothetical protein
MSESAFTDERLREALTEEAEPAAGGRDCPDASRIWQSARRELEPEENEKVLLHVASCAACSLAWRVAQDLGPRTAVGQSASGRRPGRSHLWIGLAAAALVVVAIGLGVVFRPGPAEKPGTVYRTQEATWLRSILDEGAALPREDFVLVWAEGPEGTLYDVLVTTASLDPVAQGAGLKVAEFRVAPEALADLPSGSTVLWQVTARLRDGRLVESESFFARVE